MTKMPQNNDEADGERLEDVDKRVIAKTWDATIWRDPVSPVYFFDPPRPNDEDHAKKLGVRYSPKGVNYIKIHSIEDYNFMDFMDE
jgi:hypothetical protein